nr:hypothetical protein [uncultured bacterium]AOE07898.1 hypothetical protein [uncultured bacterium]
MRRSSANSKLLLLPLDLHVLSLPLAFILSQDQTLHRVLLIILTPHNSKYPVNNKLLVFKFFVIIPESINTRCQFNKSMNFS